MNLIGNKAGEELFADVVCDNRVIFYYLGEQDIGSLQAINEYIRKGIDPYGY